MHLNLKTKIKKTRVHHKIIYKNQPKINKKLLFGPNDFLFQLFL